MIVYFNPYGYVHIQGSHIVKIKQWFVQDNFVFIWRFNDGGQRHIKTSPLICRANQWTGYYMISASVVKELNFYMTF